MPEKTEAQKKAQKKYMEKFMVAQVRMERTKYADIQTAAAAAGESVNAYINTSITRRMEQDGPSETAESPSRDGAVSLPSDILKAAQVAAEAAGEAVPEFVARAVETQAQRDKISRKMKGGKPNE